MTAMRTDASTGELTEVPDDAAQTGDLSKDAKGTPTMHIKIASPFKTYFDEAGYSLSAVNATGPFDILPHHHNFLTLLSQGELVVRPVRSTKEVKVRISGGLMHVKADRVSVFLDV